MPTKKPTLHGSVFLILCLAGAPLVLTTGSGCSREAHAGQPTDPVTGQGQTTSNGFWREGDAVADPEYDPELSLAPMLDAVRPAVVSISSSKSGPFGQMGSGIGSGFIISPDGLVVTNHHVAASGKQFEVTLDDGRVFEATVVGGDPQTDLAVLRLSGAKELPTVVLGSSSDLRVGDWVIAVGSPMGLSQTVTRGILSAKGRGSLGLYRDGYADFLQTDAAINPGNSGGPLFNLAGEVIGINTAVGGGVDGLGFAVPIDQAKAVLPRLIKDGKIKRGWMGISNAPEDKPAYGQFPARGALIGEIHADTPAAKAGLLAGDRVIEADGEAIEDFDHLRTMIGERAPADVVKLKVVRNGEQKLLEVELAERPDPDSLETMVRPPMHRRSEPAPAPTPAPTPTPTPQAPSTDIYGGGPARLGVEIGSDLKIVRVLPGGVGEQLGLQAGDVIQRVNGRPVDSVEAVLEALEADRTKVDVDVERGDKSVQLSP